MAQPKSFRPDVWVLICHKLAQLRQAANRSWFSSASGAAAGLPAGGAIWIFLGVLGVAAGSGARVTFLPAGRIVGQRGFDAKLSPNQFGFS